LFSLFLASPLLLLLLLLLFLLSLCTYAVAHTNSRPTPVLFLFRFLRCAPNSEHKQSSEEEAKFVQEKADAVGDWRWSETRRRRGEEQTKKKKEPATAVAAGGCFHLNCGFLWR
jgi:hypothetical protein